MIDGDGNYTVWLIYNVLYHTSVLTMIEMNFYYKRNDESWYNGPQATAYGLQYNATTATKTRATFIGDEQYCNREKSPLTAAKSGKST